jgi:hypothetical protein
MLNVVQLQKCSIGPAQRCHCKDIACLQYQRLCILCGVFCVKRDGQCYYSNRLDSFAVEAIERLHRFLELLLVITHFLKVHRKSISA